MRTLAIFIILLSVICSHKIFSQVVISGKQTSYAGTELVFKTFSDPFTDEETDLGKCVVSDSGEFSVSIPIKETTLIIVHLGVYKGFLYIEPDKHYTILLPDKKDKTKAEKLNPFFEESEFHFAIKDISPDDLNFKILSFDDAYQPYLQKFAENMRVRNKTSLLDTAISDLKKNLSGNSNVFFNSYVNYKIGYLKNLAYQQKSKSISRQYFENCAILYNNPSYLNLFNQVYNKYFYYFGLGNNGKKIFEAVNSYKSYYSLNKILLLDSVLLNDSLRELVILKNIHDEFYSSFFSRSGLLAILDSLALQTRITRHKEYALLIKDKITRLMPGFEPPPFELFDRNKKLVKLSDFIGSYVYLNFCTCSSYGCIKEFDLLEKMYEKYQGKLVIITISTDETIEEMIDYLNKSNFKWTFLHYENQPDILEEYDIRAYPYYFLIGPDGKLILSPAKSPAESFEMDLFKTMRARGDI
jgi:peroxiredoxin